MARTEKDTFTLDCDCESNGCRHRVTLPLAEARRIAASGFVLIVKACPTGASGDDEKLEDHEGYAIYKARAA